MTTFFMIVSCPLRRVRRTTLRRAVQHARTVPPALGAHQHIGIDAERDRIRIRIGVDDDLDIGVVGEEELGGAFELFPAHLDVVAEQVLLRAAVDAAIAFRTAELDAGLHQPRTDMTVAEFVAHRQPLELGEAREVANAQAADGLLSDIGSADGSRKNRCRRIPRRRDSPARR